jgi:hypothetical protein
LCTPCCSGWSFGGWVDSAIQEMEKEKQQVVVLDAEDKPDSVDCSPGLFGPLWVTAEGVLV